MQSNKKKKTPALANWLVSKLIDEKLLEEFFGDLREIYEDRVSTKGSFFAKLMYWVDALHLLIGFASFKLFKSQNNHSMMHKHYLIIAFRNLARTQIYSILNITGLAIGMLVFLMIALYVQFEKSYEDFIPQRESIYRLSLTSYINNELAFSSAENYPAAGPALKNELPEIETFARLYNMGYKNNVIITYEDAEPDPIALKHRRFLYADSSFLPMMQYPMVSGDSRTALAQPFTAVISETYAKGYFGNENPIGKMIRMQDDDSNNELVKITGVFKDLSFNTHLKFDVLFSYETLYGRDSGSDHARERYDHAWWRKDMYTFIKVRAGTDPKTLESKFPSIIEKYNPGLKDRNQHDIFFLQPLKDIHLTSNLSEEAEANGDARIVFFLALIGIFVIVIAWINYVNLSTAKALERAKEVGVRKVMGAFKTQLIRQFLIEATIVNLLSVILALLAVALVIPYFNSLSGLHLQIEDMTQRWFLALLLGLWITGAFLSGSYPALVLSSFRPITVLKGKLKNSMSGILLRRSLVILQFMASIALISSTLIVYRQLDFMMNQDLGVNIDQVLVVERPGILSRDRKAFNSAIDVFKNEVKKDPSVEAVSTSVTVPGKQREWKTVIKKYGAPDDQSVTLRINTMDYDFMDVFKMKLIAGRTFSEEHTNDPDTAVIISELASRLLGFNKPEDAIGHTLTMTQWEWNPIIVGVVNDYHQVSLKKSLDPMIFTCMPYEGEYYSVRIRTNDLSTRVAHVQQAFEKAFPGNPFEYFFLDDFFNRQYENERKFGNLFTSFAGLAMVVGCLGLFGLSAYTVTQRTKEIGIRKALGSTDQGIFVLLSKEYVKLVLVSIVLSVPLVWLPMNSWIESFPYRTSISPLIFVIAGMAVLVISVFTVSLQTVKAARTNPVDSLRCE
jgi:putative ABC transport system permease protein